MASTMMGEERTPTTGMTTGNYGISHYSVTNGNTADEPIEKQQGFVGNKIEFPEIVKDEDEAPPAPKPRMGVGRKRFTSIAVKVMAQLSLNRPDDSIEEEEAEKSAQKEGEPSTPRPRVKKVSRAGGRNKFASLVRLAKYKKMMAKPATGSTEEEKKEEKIDLPQKPRFGAMLSPEAQYAMLKGYEDLLLKSLKTTDKAKENQPPPQLHVHRAANTSISHHHQQQKPAVSSQPLLPPPLSGLTPVEVAAAALKRPSVLYRVKTPHFNVVSLHLNGLEQKSSIAEEDEPPAPDSPRPVVGRRQTWDIRPAPYHGQLYRIDSNKEDQSTAKAKKENMNKALLPRISTMQLDPRDKAVPKDRQLLLTHRFHCAMDLLDKMRESQGLVVTSPRYKHRTLDNPPDNYNTWSREWSREFKLEYREK